MIPYANIPTALDRSAGRILMLAGYSERKSCNPAQSVAVAGGLWYNHSETKRVPSIAGGYRHVDPEGP